MQLIVKSATYIFRIEFLIYFEASWSSIAKTVFSVFKFKNSNNMRKKKIADTKNTLIFLVIVAITK